MTDQELIDLVEQKTPEELSLAEIDELRRRLADSLPLREAVAGHLQLEQQLGDALGGMHVSVDRILAATDAAGMGPPRPFAGWMGWGLAGLIALFVASLIVLPQVFPDRPLGDAVPAMVASADPGVEEDVAGRVTNGAGQPAQAGTNDAASGPADAPQPGDLPEDESSPSDAPFVATAGPKPALPAEGPWTDDLRQEGDPLPFEAVCFDDFPPDVPGPPASELRQWLVSADWAPLNVQERPRAPPLVEGLLRLAAPWPADATLRLSLAEQHGLKLHFWSGRQGVTLYYFEYPRPQWVAYTTTRPRTEARPLSLALAATDNDRYRRSGAGTVELRYSERALVLSRGDVRLLTARLDGPPTEVYLDGRAAIRGIRMVRSQGPAAETNPRPVVLRARRPATMGWRSELPDGWQLLKHPDGAIELAGGKTSAAAWASLPIGEAGLHEVIFEVEDATPGSGVCLADERGRPLHRVGFFRDARTGWTSFGFADAGDARTESYLDPDRGPAPYAGRRQWLRLVLGAGTLKCWTSADGLHWGQALEPRTDARGLKAFTHVGIYCQSGEAPRRIRLRGVEVRELSAIAALAPAQLRESALALADDPDMDLAEWRRQVQEAEPADVDGGQWRRACAVQTLVAGPSRNLGNDLLELLLNEVYAAGGPVEEVVRLLDETALLADTWQADIARDEALRIADRYRELGLDLARQGYARPASLVARALLTAPLMTDAEIDCLPEDLLRRELLGAVYRDDWTAVRGFCRRVRYLGASDDPYRPLLPRRAAALQLVNWAQARSAIQAGDEREAAEHPLPPAWRHPLVEELNKEAYNILAEFNAALAGQSYRDACQTITSADTQNSLGLLPDGRDARLRVSLAEAVRLALAEHPPLARTMNKEFSALGLIRVRQAAEEGDVAAVEAATVQFSGTEAASEARLWLADQSLAAGDFSRALAEYQRALGQDDAGNGNGGPQPEIQARRRLAAALVGRDEGEPVTRPVELAGVSQTAAEFEALVAELRVRQAGAASAAADDATNHKAEPPTPSHYYARPLARFDGAFGTDVGNVPVREMDWAGRQLAAVVAGDRMLVSNRFQVTAYSLASGQAQWTASLAARQGPAHAWPGVAMRPLLAGDRVFVRWLAAEGPELACLAADTGAVLWTAETRDLVATDPILIQDQLFAVTVAVEQDRTLRLSLSTFDPRDGALLAQRPLAQVRDHWDRQLPCQAVAVGDRMLVSFAGTVLACDLGGRPHWLRRQEWLPLSEEPGWLRQTHEAPLVWQDRCYVSQPGVRAVECVALDSGRLHWRQAVEDIERIAGLDEGRLIVRTTSGFSAFDAMSGKLLWERAVPDLLDAFGLGSGLLAYTERERLADDFSRPRLVWIETATGTLRGAASLEALADRLPMLGPLVQHGAQWLAFRGRGDEDPSREIVILEPNGPLTPAATDAAAR